MDFPDRQRADDYLAEDATPALEEVARELEAQGVDVVVESVIDEDAEPAAELRAGVGEQPFVYRVQRCAAALPSYGGRVPRGGDRYYRLEVHLRDGGQGYDVMGYTRAQLIDDVLDQYERHLEFLRLADA